jgi:hypothetical protein
MIWDAESQEPKSLMISGTIQIHRKIILKKRRVSMPRTASDPKLPFTDNVREQQEIQIYLPSRSNAE